MKLHEIREDVDLELDMNDDDDNGNGENDVAYDDVFNAVAKHCGCDPEDIDASDEETKKKFYDTLDQCWDEEEDRVPDGCPVDINGERDGDDDEDESDEEISV